MAEEGQQDRSIQERFEECVDLLDRGRNSQALRQLLSIVEEQPGHVGALNKAGVAYAHLGEMEGARICFTRAIITNPRCVPALSNLGNIYFDRGDNQRAIALYKKALKYDPDYHVAHNNLAAAYKQTGQVSKQVTHFKKGQKLRFSSKGTRSATQTWTESDATSEETTTAAGAEGERSGAWEELDAGRGRGCLGRLMGVMAMLAAMVFALVLM